MSSEFNRMRQLAGIKEVNIAPGGKTYYAYFNYTYNADNTYYIIAYSKESMINKLNKAYKELTGESYTPYNLDNLDETYRIKFGIKFADGTLGAYIHDDWAWVGDNKSEFNEQIRWHQEDGETPPKENK